MSWVFGYLLASLVGFFIGIAYTSQQSGTETSNSSKVITGSVTGPLLVWSFQGGVMWGVIAIGIVAIAALSGMRLLFAHKERLQRQKLDAEVIRKELRG